MTLENNVYGPPWVCCTYCTVRQPLASLQHQVGTRYTCKDTERCKKYQLELKLDLKAAAIADPVLFTRRDDEMLAEIHSEKAFTTVTTYAFPPDHK